MDSIILFDFDGTIADTISAGLEIINSHADKFGYKKLEGDINTHLSAFQLVKLAEIKFWKLPYLIYQLKEKLSEKSDEIQLFSEAETLIKKMKEAGLETDVDETGTTFEENAILKAKAVAEKAREYEKDGYTWIQGESLSDLIRPERVRQIKLDQIKKAEDLKEKNKSKLLIDMFEDNEINCANCFI